jgi:hypothetical protein
MEHVSFIQQSPSIVVVQAMCKWSAPERATADDDEPDETLVGNDTYQFLLTLTETVPSAADAIKFTTLVNQWKGGRSATSSVTDMITHPAYQKIIGMGKGVVPFIISELRADGEEPDHWFWALRILTDVDPVRPEDRGDIVKMANAWLEWAEKEYGW